jgi:hypothetical protein
MVVSGWAVETGRLASVRSVGGTRHNNYGKRISRHESKVSGHIRTICVYRKGATTTRCIVSGWVVSLASKNSVGGTKHNNHNSKSIFQYETKVSGHIGTIWAYRKV